MCQVALECTTCVNKQFPLGYCSCLSISAVISSTFPLKKVNSSFNSFIIFSLSSLSRSKSSNLLEIKCTAPFSSRSCLWPLIWLALFDDAKFFNSFTSFPSSSNNSSKFWHTYSLLSFQQIHYLVTLPNQNIINLEFLPCALVRILLLNRSLNPFFVTSI